MTPSMPRTAQEKKEQIEAAVMLTRDGHPRSLLERMVDYAIPGVSIAIINDYQLEWACGYGVCKTGEPEQITSDTLFQGYSISKAVTAIAILRLVEEGRLDLDVDVNRFLKSWKIPANRSWLPEVTLRQLLSHTAGTNVAWFAGYHRDQDTPTLREVLDGEQPANTPSIRITTLPGTRFRYSGGGYCILQQLLMDVMQQPFPKLMSALVLKPLGMIHSAYEQPLPSHRAKMAATGHRAKGKPVAGNWHVYPELAAAGLWTTPSDLARFALMLQYALEEKPHHLLSTQMVKELLIPQSHGNDSGDMGLGIFVQGEGSYARFGHPGDNTGFTSLWVSLMQGGQGCILMTNSDNGWSLQNELLHTIAQVYAWPELPPRKKHEDFDAEVDDTIVGEYELRSNLSLTISKTDKHLSLQISGQPLCKLLKHSEDVYLLANVDDTITFMRDVQGHVQVLILQQEETEMVALKRTSLV